MVRGPNGLEGSLRGSFVKFFDETHTLKSVRPTLKGDSADVQVVVNWQALVCGRLPPPRASGSMPTHIRDGSWSAQPRDAEACYFRLYRSIPFDYLPGSATISAALNGSWAGHDFESLRGVICRHGPTTRHSPGANLYEEHIALIRKKDINGILQQYAEDALLISSFTRNPQYFRGHEELTTHFKGLFDVIVGLTSDIAFWAETENPQTLMIVEAVVLQFPDGDQKMRFADSWVLRDGKIAIHFAGMVQYPDGSLA